MKKRLALVIALVMAVSVITIGFSACNKAEEPAKEEPTQEATEPEASEAPEALATEESPADTQTQEVMSKGPHGEEASSAQDLILTDEEITKIKEGKYKAAICFHYGGNDWSKAQLAGLTDRFNELGIEIIATTDADFDPAQQTSDIETVMASKPDILISIPTDAVATEKAYQEAAAAGAKIVFMDNCPPNMKAGTDYVSVVSADNYGNGVASARIMGEKLNGKGKIAMVYYDADFFVTNQRDEAFEATIKNEFPGIEIIEKSGFDDENATSTNGDAVLTKYPDIDGIFATWDIPAEGVVSAAVAAGRDDLVVTTIDLGDNVAKNIAEDGSIKGLGAQRPYDQGVAEATLAAYGLLGKEAPPYVAVPALPVTRDNVADAYKEVYHKDAPAFITDALNK